MPDYIRLTEDDLNGGIQGKINSRGIRHSRDEMAVRLWELENMIISGELANRKDKDAT